MYRDRELALEFMRRRGRVVKQIERFDFAGYLFEPF
jgi:hypothetical protein